MRAGSFKERDGPAPPPHNNQGLLLRRGGGTDQAIQAFERALAIAPGSASALWNLSDLLARSRPAAERGERSDELLVQAVEQPGLPGAARTGRSVRPGSSAARKVRRSGGLCG